VHPIDQRVQDSPGIPRIRFRHDPSPYLDYTRGERDSDRCPYSTQSAWIYVSKKVRYLTTIYLIASLITTLAADMSENAPSREPVCQTVTNQ
jgi:hypothetical protein